MLLFMKTNYFLLSVLFESVLRISCFRNNWELNASQVRKMMFSIRFRFQGHRCIALHCIPLSLNGGSIIIPTTDPLSIFLCSILRRKLVSLIFSWSSNSFFGIEYFSVENRSYHFPCGLYHGALYQFRLVWKIIVKIFFLVGLEKVKILQRILLFYFKGFICCSRDNK